MQSLSLFGQFLRLERTACRDFFSSCSTNLDAIFPREMCAQRYLFSVILFLEQTGDVSFNDKDPIPQGNIYDIARVCII